MARGILKLALCWHMHQPSYREADTGQYRLPWVYLHGIKDYTDMVWHLENHPGMKLVVNFAPVLLEQIDDYVIQLNQYLDNGVAMSDPLLNLLAGECDIPDSTDARKKLIEDCQRCYRPTMIDRHPAFRQLVDFSASLLSTDDESGFSSISYLDSQFFIDILMWYHMAWLGESIQQLNDIQILTQKQFQFSMDDRRQLLSIMRDGLQSIIPRYRKLAENKQIEISMTPYGHPIIPLLHDFNAMDCAQPDAPKPSADHYPGGKDRAHWHMQHGFEVFQQYFGFKPKGVWLSEGGISDSAIELLDQYDVQWTATGEAVWRNSCLLAECGEAELNDRRNLFSAYTYHKSHSKIFFRDDGLSDLIGFEYSKWSADDAVADFIQHLENIHQHLGENVEQHVVNVILDGENAWEYYPENARDFLDKLYAALVKHELIEPVSFSDINEQVSVRGLDKLCAGSWVYGSFSTWIGQDDKNRAWEYLVMAKQAYDQVMQSSSLSDDSVNELARQLAICEGSDWFWWFGDYNSSDSVRDFDQLFRLQLKNLYNMLDVAIPEHLDVSLSQGSGDAENSGTMRRN